MSTEVPHGGEHGDGGTIGERLGVPSPERAAIAPSGEHVGTPRTASTEGTPLSGDPQRDPEPDPARARRDERIVAALFTLSGACTIFFVAYYWVANLHDRYYTQYLGLSLAASLILIGVAAIYWVKTLMNDEEAVQDRHSLYDQRENDVAGEVFMQGVADSAFLKRPLLRRTFIASQALLGIPAVVLLRSLAPTQPQKAFEHTHWKPGDRLFDAQKFQPIQLLDPAKGVTLDIGGFVTVLPESALTIEEVKDTQGNVIERRTVVDHEIEADSVTMLLRLDPNDFDPNNHRTDYRYVVEGHVAYSKLCTHLGCPVSLYEQQTHKLLCPCHQSQFLVTEGARPVFGPAARSLPQLPIMVDEEGFFRCVKDFDQPVGPGYWERT
jgi:ubiquinol-cytochrome c reductase iron-sulfur subunit